MASGREKRVYKTAWFFEEHENIDKQIYDIVYNYLKQGRYSKQQELWAKYFVTLYLGGFRRVEPFLLSPTIEKHLINNVPFYYVIKANAKHFKRKEVIDLGNGKKTWRGVGDRERMKVVFMPANEYEGALWNFIAPHERQTLDFTPLLGRRQDLSALNELSDAFSERFKARITDGKRTEENGGVTPHMLRHARAYDLHIIEGYPDYIVQKIMGWNKRDMLDWYTDIKDALNTEEMEKIYQGKLEERRNR